MAGLGRIRDGLSRFIADEKYDVVCIQETIWSDSCNEYLELYVDTIDKIAKMANFLKLLSMVQKC